MTHSLAIFYTLISYLLILKQISSSLHKHIQTDLFKDAFAQEQTPRNFHMNH